MSDTGAGYTPSAKYASVYAPCVDRIFEEERRKHKNARDCERAVRNRLYQITGAYAPSGSAARIFERGMDERLDSLRGVDNYASALEWCAHFLAAHASTRERLPVLKAFYDYIGDICAGARIVADYGCGVNPFALPLWRRSDMIRYDAYDVDTRSIGYANALFRRIGLPEAAQASDLAVETPPAASDAALLLKLLPVLDMQRDGRGIQLLREIQSPVKIVSFPLSGLSGTNRARRIDGTAARFERVAMEAGIAIRESRRIWSEMVYVI
ncbi:MAG: hypothetical protein LBB86_02415 [Oscillospiraceae bacterium]|nr:hypothetical protein [Oscillospiraceae bacterium]